MALMDPVLTTRENPEWSLCGISRPFLKARFSETHIQITGYRYVARPTRYAAALLEYHARVQLYTRNERLYHTDRNGVLRELQVLRPLFTPLPHGHVTLPAHTESKMGRR